MSRATDVLGRAGWSIVFAFLVAPAFAPVRELITTATELTGAPTPDWLPLVTLLAVGFVLAGTYDGPISLLLPTAFAVVALFVGFQWVVGLRGLNAVSMRLLAADVLVYLAAVACAVAIVFETGLRHRLTRLLGSEPVGSGSE